jgi:hypothetical protein
MTNEERAVYVRSFLKEYPQYSIFRNMLIDALVFLADNEPKWKLPKPIDPHKYLLNLLESARGPKEISSTEEQSKSTGERSRTKQGGSEGNQDTVKKGLWLSNDPGWPNSP